jgi:4-hydroxy-tetrahydrodipicolinate synthase
MGGVECFRPIFLSDPDPPTLAAHLHEALALLGKLPRAVVRPPLVKITDAEIVRIRDALMEAELLGSRTALGRNAA